MRSGSIGLVVWLVWLVISMLAIPFTGLPRIQPLQEVGGATGPSPEDEEVKEAEDPDVAAERERIEGSHESGEASGDRVRTNRLRKVWRKDGNHIAIT